jgi:competence protein ComEA
MCVFLPMRPSSSILTILAFVAVIVVIVVGAALLLSSRPEPVTIVINPPVPTATPLPTQTPAPILVYVTGEVAKPETTVSLPAGSRVQDALDAAGGVTANADLERVNLAGILRDGDQVHVPSISGAAAELPTPSGGSIVYINTATLEELDMLPGVGPALAQAIIEYREANGPFTSMEDLDQVSGIGPAMLEDLEGLISFER